MKYDNIFDLMIDKPYTFLIVGIVAIYLGDIRIFPDRYILYGLNYVLIIMGIIYMAFSIVFTIIKNDDKKHEYQMGNNIA